jgi:GntR family transcriptional regulator/MocR family aminotransferase
MTWARNCGAVVIEDDYHGELRYHRQPVGALQALDPHSVLYAGTASKPLAPALHVGHALVRLASYRAERNRGRYRRDAA